MHLTLGKVLLWNIMTQSITNHFLVWYLTCRLGFLRSTTSRRTRRERAMRLRVRAEYFVHCLLKFWARPRLWHCAILAGELSANSDFLLLLGCIVETIAKTRRIKIKKKNTYYFICDNNGVTKVKFLKDYHLIAAIRLTQWAHNFTHKTIVCSCYSCCCCCWIQWRAIRRLDIDLLLCLNFFACC